MKRTVMRKLLTAALVILSAGTGSAQDRYEAPEVRISRDKVRVDGKVYLSHVVEPKQTLWSICKAYEVSAADIYAANPTLDLAVNGLKTGQIIMIPTKKYRQNPVEGENTATPVFPPALVPAEDFPEQSATADPMPTDSVSAVPENVFVYDIPERISLALVIPLSNGLDEIEGNVDFYSGVLMACRELGGQGIGIDLTVCNTSENEGLGVAATTGSADVVIGPIAAKDAARAAANLRPGRALVSPLDPKAALLTDSLRIVQAPSTWESQTREMVKWCAEEIQPGDTVLVVSESDVATSPESKFLYQELDRNGIRYSRISYGILQGLSMASNFESRASRTGTTRFFAASENEAFVGDVIRQANLLAYKEYKATVYCPSKVRSFSLIDVESFHNVDLRLSSTYFIDYGAADTKAFIMAYRALFGAEPNSYAFQGYDTAKYFVSACAKYGRNWLEKLDEFPGRGLQTDFSFEKSSSEGRVNTAVRRIIYNKDFSITVL